MEVHWSNHAIERAEQRFGDRESVSVPAERIISVAQVMPIGGNFKIREKDVVFMCARSNNGCVIKTVTVAEWI